MRKKLAVLFLGAALTVSMLGACGGKDAASSSASAVSASSAADASSASVQDASKAESSTSTMFQQKAHRQRRLQEKAAHQSWKTVRIRQTSIQTAICSMSMKQKKERVS